MSNEILNERAVIPTYIKQLKFRGTTRRSLYEEYLKERSRGYSYCSFCLYLRREKEIRLLVGRLSDQMYVDFASDKLCLSDENTGDKVPVEVFAAILPYSQITYYEVVLLQKKEYLIQACENAFHYFGGVPNTIVPDNLKSVATKPGSGGSMNIQESEEFKPSKFYCKTDFDMKEIKKEETDYVPLPKFYTFEM